MEDEEDKDEDGYEEGNEEEMRTFLKALLMDSIRSMMTTDLAPPNFKAHYLHNLFIPAKDRQGETIYDCLYRELHIVDDLKAKILIGNDVNIP